MCKSSMLCRWIKRIFSVLFCQIIIFFLHTWKVDKSTMHKTPKLGLACMALCTQELTLTHFAQWEMLRLSQHFWAGAFQPGWGISEMVLFHQVRPGLRQISSWQTISTRGPGHSPGAGGRDVASQWGMLSHAVNDPEWIEYDHEWFPAGCPVV